MIKITGPLFKWFGSKWASSKLLPGPLHMTIIEPFAGGAGYALRYNHHNVELYESNLELIQLWRFLINAKSRDILEIPINLAIGTDIRTIGLSADQALLLKYWQRTNNIGPCYTVSGWGNLPGQWTKATRSRIAVEIEGIRHWKVMGQNGFTAFGNHKPATWFVDPPYQYNYDYKGKFKFNHEALARAVGTCKGQIIVCEALCPKTRSMPDYLPFKFWGERVTSRRKSGNHTHSCELIYETNE